MDIVAETRMASPKLQEPKLQETYGDALLYETILFRQYDLGKVNKLHDQGQDQNHMVGQNAENKIAGLSISSFLDVKI